jgi:hypothetical protein
MSVGHEMSATFLSLAAGEVSDLPPRGDQSSMSTPTAELAASARD